MGVETLVFPQRISQTRALSLRTLAYFLMGSMKCEYVQFVFATSYISDASSLFLVKLSPGLANSTSREYPRKRTTSRLQPWLHANTVIVNSLRA
jgi:hypothetical protein